MDKIQGGPGDDRIEAEFAMGGAGKDTFILPRNGTIANTGYTAGIDRIHLPTRRPVSVAAKQEITTEGNVTRLLLQDAGGPLGSLTLKGTVALKDIFLCRRCRKSFFSCN